MSQDPPRPKVLLHYLIDLVFHTPDSHTSENYLSLIVVPFY